MFPLRGGWFAAVATLFLHLPRLRKLLHPELEIMVEQCITMGCDGAECKADRDENYPVLPDAFLDYCSERNVECCGLPENLLQMMLKYSGVELGVHFRGGDIEPRAKRGEFRGRDRDVWEWKIASHRTATAEGVRAFVAERCLKFRADAGLIVLEDTVEEPLEDSHVVSFVVRRNTVIRCNHGACAPVALVATTSPSKVFQKIEGVEEVTSIRNPIAPVSTLGPVFERRAHTPVAHIYPVPAHCECYGVTGGTLRATGKVTV